jgi:predicted enzyme related to lactoylglutathione lyase
MFSCRGGFAWYELITTDMNSAKAFYQDVMGWGALDASLPNRAYTLFAAGNTLVGGLMRLTRESAEQGGRSAWLGYVEVSDVDAIAERVKALGGAVHLPPTDLPNTSRYCIFADPQAARLAVLKWLNPAQRPSEPAALGRVGWHELLAANWELALNFYVALFGWEKASSETGQLGHYQTFAACGQSIGGIVTKPSTIAVPFWLYYFHVSDLTEATRRVNAAGGRILGGPFELSSGSGIVQCADPQGAIFALQGKPAAKAVGYFKDRRGRQWSW